MYFKTITNHDLVSPTPEPKWCWIVGHLDYKHEAAAKLRQTGLECVAA